MRNLMSLLLGAVCLIAVSGCGSSNTSFSSIKNNLTPELQGMSDRSIDNKRNVAVTNNLNLRMLSDDIGRAFYTDQPSRLSPYSILDTNGNPR